MGAWAWVGAVGAFCPGRPSISAVALAPSSPPPPRPPPSALRASLRRPPCLAPHALHHFAKLRCMWRRLCSPCPDPPRVARPEPMGSRCNRPRLVIHFGWDPTPRTTDVHGDSVWARCPGMRVDVARAVVEGLVVASLVRDMGQPGTPQVRTDSSAALDICSRTDVGKVRHLDSRLHWDQAGLAGVGTAKAGLRPHASALRSVAGSVTGRRSEVRARAHDPEEGCEPSTPCTSHTHAISHRHVCTCARGPFVAFAFERRPKRARARYVTNRV